MTSTQDGPTFYPPDYYLPPEDERTIGYLLHPSNTKVARVCSKNQDGFVCITRGDGTLHICSWSFLPGKKLGDQLSEEEFRDFEYGRFHERLPDPQEAKKSIRYHWPYAWPQEWSGYRMCLTGIVLTMPWADPRMKPFEKDLESGPTWNETTDPISATILFLPNCRSHPPTSAAPACSAFHLNPTPESLATIRSQQAMYGITPYHVTAQAIGADLASASSSKDTAMADAGAVDQSETTDPAMADAGVVDQPEATNPAKKKNKGKKKNNKKKKKSKKTVIDEDVMFLEADKPGGRVAPLSVDRNGEPLFDYLGSPDVPLSQLSYRDIRVIDTFFGPPDPKDDEIRGPFYLRICYHDTSQPEEKIPDGLKDYESFAGSWQSLFYANQVAVNVAIMRHREMYHRYYYPKRCVEVKCDEFLNDNGTQYIMAQDKRFYITVHVMPEPLPEYVDWGDVVWLSWTEQPDIHVGVAQLEIAGPVKCGVMPEDSPAIGTARNMGHNLANKSAAMIFYQELKDLMYENEMKQCLFKIAKAAEVAWTSMNADESEAKYNWTFEHSFKSLIKYPKEIGGDRITKATLRVWMETIEPWGFGVRNMYGKSRDGRVAASLEQGSESEDEDESVLSVTNLGNIVELEDETEE